MRRIIAQSARGTATGGSPASPEARQEFMTQTGYPHGRPGYVVDHVIPLKRGGADAPWNMQWQTIAEGKAKDATGMATAPHCDHPVGR